MKTLLFYFFAPRWMVKTSFVMLCIFTFFFFLFLAETGLLSQLWTDALWPIIYGFFNVLGSIFHLLFALVTGACGTPGVCVQ